MDNFGNNFIETTTANGNRHRIMLKRKLKLAHRYTQRLHFAAVQSKTRGQNSISRSSTIPPTSTTPLLQVMKYEVPLVLVVLTLKYQGKAETIFQESPVALWCFYAGSFGYWVIVGALKEITTLSYEWIQTLRRAALASALLSAISLLCIFLPYPLSLVPLAIVITSPISLAALYAFSLFIEWAVNKMHRVLVWARRGDSRDVLSLV